jgi:hypothetical protein
MIGLALAIQSAKIFTSCSGCLSARQRFGRRTHDPSLGGTPAVALGRSADKSTFGQHCHCSGWSVMTPYLLCQGFCSFAQNA